MNYPFTLHGNQVIKGLSRVYLTYEVLCSQSGRHAVKGLAGPKGGVIQAPGCVQLIDWYRMYAGCGKGFKTYYFNNHIKHQCDLTFISVI